MLRGTLPCTLGVQRKRNCKDIATFGEQIASFAAGFAKESPDYRPKKSSIFGGCGKRSPARRFHIFKSRCFQDTKRASADKASCMFG